MNDDAIDALRQQFGALVYRCLDAGVTPSMLSDALAKQVDRYLTQLREEAINYPVSVAPESRVNSRDK